MPTNEDYDIGEAFEAIENELISSMIRNMKRHKVEEADEEKQWEMWQALQLEALEKYKKDNAKKYGKQFRDINRKIESLIRIANQEGMMDQETEILKRIKDGFKGLKKSSPGATAEFFKLNDRKLNALIKATTSDMEKAERAILRMSNDKYRKVIYNAQVYANTGAGTYEKAVDMATKDFLSAGINCVEYKNGSRHSVQEYASMALRTASKRAYLQGEGTKRQEWGISTVIVNKRGNPCPLCLPFVGKVFIDDVWSGGSRKDGPYPLLSSAMDAGLYHPNCRDSHTTYFPGISTPPDKQTFTEEDVEKAVEVEKAEQKESHAKKQEERMERLSENSLDPENKKKYEARAEQWNEKQEEAKNETREIRGDDQDESDLLSKARRALLKTVSSKEIINYDGLPDSLKKSFEEGLKNANSNVKEAIGKIYKDTDYVLLSEKRSYYSRGIFDYVALGANVTPSTMAHELFHRIDRKLGISRKLKSSLINDYAIIQSKGEGDIVGYLFNQYPDAFIKRKTGKLVLKKEYRGISDIINGLSNGDIYLGFGHKNSYWQRKGKLEKESWAQFGRIMYCNDPTVIKMFMELFPSFEKQAMRELMNALKML